MPTRQARRRTDSTTALSAISWTTTFANKFLALRARAFVPGGRPAKKPRRLAFLDARSSRALQRIMPMQRSDGSSNKASASSQSPRGCFEVHVFAHLHIEGSGQVGQPVSRRKPPAALASRQTALAHNFCRTPAHGANRQPPRPIADPGIASAH